MRNAVVPSHEVDRAYFIGRDFLDFVCNFCLGMKAYEVLPEDRHPFPQQLCYKFHRFPLPKNKNETLSEEEKIRKQKLETRKNIWKRNLETGIILKLAQTYEKQGQFVEALILYIQHPLYYLGVMEKICLYRAFRRLHEALGETLFRQVCWAASKNVTYKQLFAAMNHVWLWNAPTVIEGEQYQNFQAYHSDNRLYRASDYPEEERISAFGHEKIENLDEILIEPITQPDPEFLQVWQSYLQSVRTCLVESSAPDDFSSEKDIWWKNMISGSVWKLARSYENQGLFLEALVLYLKATHLDNFAYSEDHSERYGQFLKAIANLRDKLGDVRFCQIYRATTGCPIDVGMFEGLREDTNLSLYGNSIPDSEIIDQFPDPEPEFLQIWQNLEEVKQSFSSAEAVGNFTVFNIKGNRYRLILFINYQKQIAFFKYFLTHADYDKDKWKNDPYYQQ